MKELEVRLRSFLQSKAKQSYDRLPTAGEGNDGDMCLCYHNGSFYFAVKMRNQWRFFSEAKAVNFSPGDQLTQAISAPPTQAEVEAIQDKVNELVALLGRFHLLR